MPKTTTSNVRMVLIRQKLCHFLKWIERIVCPTTIGSNVKSGSMQSGSTLKKPKPAINKPCHAIPRLALPSPTRPYPDTPHPTEACPTLESLHNTKIPVKLRNFIIRNEGTRLKMYKDSLGIWTIGVGRNIQENGIRQCEADFMLDNDIRQCLKELRSRFGWFESIGEGRQHAMCDLNFNMGIVRLLGFKKMLSAMSQGDFPRAATELLDSRYATQVPFRARKVAYLILRNQHADK